MAALLSTIPSLPVVNLATALAASHSAAVVIHTWRIPDPGDEPPAVYGNTVAWGAQSGPPHVYNRIYVSDVRHFKPRLFVDSGPENAGDIAISANWPAWQGWMHRVAWLEDSPGDRSQVVWRYVAVGDVP